MTDEIRTEETEPLWTDERIELVMRHPNPTLRINCMTNLRDECNQHLARIAELESGRQAPDELISVAAVAAVASRQIAKLEAELIEVYDQLAVINESSSIVASERQSRLAELEAIKASIAAKAELEAATNPTDARIDALIMSIATYTASVPVMPERDVAMTAMREIVRGWMNE